MVDLNTRLAEDELAFMIEDCAPRVLIHGAANAELAAALQDRCVRLDTLVQDGDGGVAGRSDLSYETLLAGSVPEPTEVPRRA